MLLDRLEHLCGGNFSVSFALVGSTSKRSRLREHGRHTHPLMVISAARAVNVWDGSWAASLSRPAGSLPAECDFIFARRAAWLPSQARLPGLLHNAFAQHLVFPGEQILHKIVTAFVHVV